MIKYKIHYKQFGGNLQYNFTYGELTREGLKNLLSNYDTNNKTFYDLGSGKGNVLVYAAEEFNNLEKIIGVELDENRHNLAKDMIEKKNMTDKVKVINDDFLSNKNNYSDADFIYVSNLCFPNEVNLAIYKKLNAELKDGAIIMSSKNLNFGNNFQQNSTLVAQTWDNNSEIYVNKFKK